MPSSYEHRIKADRNRAFLAGLDTAANPEWVAVAAFYTALHLVDILAARDATHPWTHREREDYLVRHPRHRAIVESFAYLERASHVARYQSKSRFDFNYPASVVTAVLLEKHYAAVENYVSPPQPAPTN